MVHKTVSYNIKKLNPFPNGKIEIQAVTIKTNKEELDIVNVYNNKSTINKEELIFYMQQINQNY